MSDQKTQMKWILFWVFLVLFTLMVLGTLGMVFFSFGSPTEGERALMVKGLILEVSACIVALFYSIFGIKEETKDFDEVEAIKEELLALQRRVSRQEPVHAGLGMSVSEDADIGPREKAFQSQIDQFPVPPPLDPSEYGLAPLPKEIEDDISSAKPFDVAHRMGSYKGMKVQWKLGFYSISDQDGGSYRIVADTGLFLFRARFSIGKDEGARFRQLNRGTVFWAAGAIQSVDELGVFLEEVKICFED